MPSPGRALSERPRSQVRPAGAVALAGLVLTLAALTFDAGPLFVPGLGFLLLGAIEATSVRLSARTAEVRRSLNGARVVEDEPLEAMIEVRRGHVGISGAEIWDPIAGAPVTLGDALSLLGGKARVELRVVAALHRRGRHAFPPPSLRLVSPLGLAHLIVPGDGAIDEVLVLPRIEPIRWIRREDRRLATGQVDRATQEPMGAGEVDGLRRYMPGAPASRIHWPALARGAGLLERRLVSTPQSQPLIVLDARTEDSSHGADRLDAAVRAVASLTVALARSGGCSVLLPGQRIPIQVGADLAAWSALHNRLALVERGRTAGPAPAIRQDAARGPLIYVAAGSPAAAAGRLVGARASQLLLVVPFGTAGQPEIAPSFEVAGCVGYLLRGRGASQLGGRAA